ncbi:MAG: ABC transporter ATP-binding protein [Actinobacteria bacterium]|jgi:iron complex transport system ATP-binding protein|nr:MAG: ABC transporter ATP-binding protein [Actinomycetota bacterium]
MEWKTLQAKDVHVAYYGEDVVSGINLKVSSGDFIGIVGPNGSGKTSFLRALSRTLRPREGLILLGEMDLYTMPVRQVARALAMVPQDNPISFGFTALEVVLMGRNPHLGRLQGVGPYDLEMARNAMEKANVWHLADRPVNELSGGERQRVIIAQALAQDTGLLLMDEPTQHLDINHQLTLLEMLSGMCASGQAVVMVVHDLNLASQYCGQLIVIRRGREFARGTPAEVLTSAVLQEVFGVGSIVTRHAVTERPHVIFLPAGNGDLEHPGPRVHLICGGASGASLMRELLERGCYVTAGVLNLGDGDEEVGRALEIRMAVESPFSHISEEAHLANLELIREAEVVVVSDLHVGSGNLVNLEAALQALTWGKRVYMFSPRPIAERDHTEGGAAALYRRLLREGARETADREELLGEVVGERRESG